MTKEALQVKKFMEFFGQNLPTKPTQLDEQTSILRASLILEECLETIIKGLGITVVIEETNSDARVFLDREWLKLFKQRAKFSQREKTDLVELADGVSDSMVVNEGTALAAGIDSENIHAIVNEANLTKTWKKSDLTEAYRLHPNCKVEKIEEDIYRVKREDGKIIKSPFFKNPIPAIREELDKQNT